MANLYGITLDDASLRWAAAEGVPESVIAAICLLHERSVEEIVAKLSPVKLEQVIKIAGRSPQFYPHGAYEALKEERHRRSTEPPAQRLSPKAAAKEQAWRVREDTDRVRRGHVARLRAASVISVPPWPSAVVTKLVCGDRLPLCYLFHWKTVI